jgi:chromatin modification-related protein VID21
MSSDWKIAMAELRHIRTMERIEQKMANGRWSLRQPKKLRAPPVRKGHWDHLLEEMEWMRLDFTEERRWKRVLALEFAIQVVEWHLSSEMDRAQLMVGSKGWQKDAPRPALAPLPRIKIDFQSKKRDSDGFYVFAEDGDVYMDSEEEDTRETAPKRTTQKQTRKEDPGDQEDVQDSSGEVLDEIMPRRGKRGRARPKRLAEEMDEDHAEEDVPLITESEDPTQPPSASEESEMNSAEIEEVEMANNSPSKADVPKTDDTSKDEPIKTDTDADAEGEEDAEGEVDAEGELDAQGEDDGGSADIVDGVIGLEGEISDRVHCLTEADHRHHQCRWSRR